MTLGERIAALRKEKGLSQEGLGEHIGVSRQAVSKWEADKAVPDVDNCVAMSKAFGIPLARLLELEEENTASADLDEQQIRLVEQVTERYLAAKEKARRRWRWPIILLICALAVGAAWMWEWLSDMNRTIDYLSGEFAGMRGEIVSGVGDRVQESLERESSLITDYTFGVTGFDPLTDTITYNVSVNLKQGKENTRVTFLAKLGSEVVTTPAERSVGLSYTGRLRCPLLDGTGIYLLVEEEGQSRSELLTVAYYESDYKIRLDGWVRWAALSQSGLAEDAFEPVEIFASHGPMLGMSEPVTVRRLEVVTLLNEEQVDTLPVDLERGSGANGEWHLNGEFDIPVDVSDAQEGDKLSFVLMMEDNYGRKSSRLLSRYTVLAGGQLEYEAYEMMELDDGTYATEVWR